MNLPQNIATFLKQLPLKNMSADQVFVAICFFLSNGIQSHEINSADVRKHWKKTIIGKKYHSSLASRAQGSISYCGIGKVHLTVEGVEYVESIITKSIPSTKTGLVIFKTGNTHSFDKFLRGIFNKAKKNIYIADTYVSGSIFDQLLDETNKTVPIQFVYGNDTDSFISRSKRFSKEYTFLSKQSKQFHDRFVIIDDIGYIMGPSLKDAADKKPATLVILNESDTNKLKDLFLDLWNGK